MSDDLTNRGEPDRSRIALSEEHEVRYWTDALGVDESTLCNAIQAVGNSAAAVREHLSAK